MASLWRILLLSVTCICLGTSFVHSGRLLSIQNIPGFLKLPLSQFTEHINSTRNAVQQIYVELPPHLTDSMPKNSSVFKALYNCRHLLDLTDDVLRRSHLITNNPNDVDFGTGDWRSDLRVWLTAAIDYQTTCLEGLDHVTIDGTIKKLISKFDNIKSLTNELFSMVSNHKSTVHNQLNFGHQQQEVLRGGVSGAPNVVVAMDGSGNFKSINEAIQASPSNSNTAYVIDIKAGVYQEYVQVPIEKRNIVLCGDGIGKTILTGDRSDSGGFEITESATLAVDGMQFMAVRLTIENTARSPAVQAVALRVTGDLSVFYLCEIKGNQDTLYAQTNRQFYKDCMISGTVDFIFGDAIAVFQNCVLISRQRDLPINVLTAQGRDDPNRPTGFVFHLCVIKAEVVGGKSTPIYLGRPWRIYARVVYMRCEMDSIVIKEGWTVMAPDAESTVFFAEYRNFGLGSDFSGRVKWPGVTQLHDQNQADAFTVAQFINGQLWLPSTGVPFKLNL